MSKLNKELWEEVQEKAKELYEHEYGEGSWEDADKYEREDWVFSILETLGKVNNETTNTNSNQKGNDTMKNTKITNQEIRMGKLAQAGIDTTNFFNINLQVPFGKEVRILVDGKEMVVPTVSTTPAIAYGNHVVGNLPKGFGVTTIMSSNGDICNAETGEVLMMANDPIVQNIINDGYVKNPKLFRRWITAQTFRMINYQAYRNPNRKGWEACMKDCYSYEYMFDMTLDELHTLAKLQQEDPEYFAERTMFFNGDVAVALLNDYLYRLKNYVKKQNRENPRTYRGDAYVKLAKYGNVLVKNLEREVYQPILNGIGIVKIAINSGNYANIENAFKDFINNYYNKLPYETTKSSVWKDAFKGSGAYYTLQNLIRFHNVILRGCTNKYDSEAELNALLDGEYRDEVWRFHKLLIDTIEYNNFDLKASIANGNAAPNTHSDKAESYIRRAINGR